MSHGEGTIYESRWQISDDRVKITKFMGKIQFGGGGKSLFQSENQRATSSIYSRVARTILCLTVAS